MDFLSLTLCNKTNFDPLQRVKYDGLETKLIKKIIYGFVLFFLI